MNILTFDLETIPQLKYRVPTGPTLTLVPGFLYDYQVCLNNDLQEHFGLDKKYLSEVAASCGEPDMPLHFNDGRWQAHNPGDPEFQYMERVAQDVRRGNAVLAATGLAPALSPITARIVQASFGRVEIVEGRDTVTTRLLQWDDDCAGGRHVNEGVGLEEREEMMEAVIVKKAFAVIGRALKKRKIIVTFHGKGFDLPMLRMRAPILGVSGGGLQWEGTHGLLYPFNNNPHCDLRMVFNSGNRYARGTLKIWSEVFGIESEEHGADVYEWVMTGKWDLLREYGGVEMTNLMELYRKCWTIV